MADAVVSFSGAAKPLSHAERNLVSRAVAQLPTLLDRRVLRWVSGGAHGIDVFAASCAMAAYPEAEHEIVLPMYLHNGKPTPCKHDAAFVRTMVADARKRDVALVVNHAPPGSTPAQGYLLRDDVLADACTDLAAFPRTATEVRRSGTWATVRRAKARQRGIHLFALDGA